MATEMAPGGWARLHTSKTNDAKPDWYIEDGLRKVHPYMYQYRTSVKERWRGRTLGSVFSTDFRDRSPAYYRKSIEAGVIQVNDERGTIETVLCNGDILTNIIHRHEPPVTASPVRVLHRDEERQLIVVEKPGSMPVHPSGRFNYNTLLAILKFDYNLPMVYCLNRLDRLTSGVMVLGLTQEAARKNAHYFGPGGALRKEYVARCKGRFPDGEVACEEPLLTIDRQIGLNVVHPDGRAIQTAKTIFNRVSYDPATDSSVLRCRPITGRSHQIRVHLQFLGHPILNDPVYHNVEAWGEAMGRGGIFPSAAPRETNGSDVAALAISLDNTALDAPAEPASPPPRPVSPSRQERLDRIRRRAAARKLQAESKLGRKKHQGLPVSPDPESAEAGVSNAIELNDKTRSVILSLRKVKDRHDDHGRSRDATFADKISWVLGDEARGEPIPVDSVGADGGSYCGQCGLPLLPDPKPEQLYIYLHAIRYQTDDWEYSSEMPWWAREVDWQTPPPPSESAVLG